jgi:hypothetical protein
MADSIKPLKGMFKDTSPVDQPDGTYRDALNAVIDVKRGAVSNEYGTKAHGEFLSRYFNTYSTVPIGCITLPDDNLIVFTASEAPHLLGPFFPAAVYQFRLSSIFHVNTKYNKDSISGNPITELYTTADVDAFTNLPFSTGDLNFKITHPITGEARVNPSEEIVIYFTDNYSNILTETQTGIEYVESYNPPRVLNVTRQLNYINPSSGVLLPALNNLYTTTSKNVSFLNVFPDTGRIAEILQANIAEGGGVETGVYHLALSYADDDFTETDVFVVSQPVSVVPLAENTIPRETITGAANETQTGKSIRWTITNSTINFDYTYLIPYIIQRIGDAVFAYKLEPVKPRPGSSSTTIAYSGLEGAAQSSVDDIIVDRAKYLTAKTLTQLDNRLYMGNLTNRKDLGYQRFANSITLDAVTETITAFDPRHFDIYNLNRGYSQMLYPDVLDPSLGGAATPGVDVPNDLRFTVKGEIRSYIENVIRPIQSGTSKGYRDTQLNTKKRGYRRGEVYAFYISFVFKDGSESYAYHIPGRRSKDIGTSTVVNEREGISSIVDAVSGFNPGEVLSSQPSAKIFQFLDTSNLGSTIDTTGYWENQNERYPTNDPDFEQWTVQPAGLPLLTGAGLQGQNVRHHKMPSNHNLNFSYILFNQDFSSPNLISNSDSTGAVSFSETIRLLGVRLSSIYIPKFILKQVQGYKIYYAKRNQYDKTIIGQSGVHPGTPYLAGNLSTTREDASRGPYYTIWHMNGNLHRTGLIHDTALWTDKSYLAQPVFKFHDFNLLRKKPTLSTATHIDIQAILTMQPWTGGFKGMQLGQVPDAVISGVDSYMYTSMRSGHGDSEYVWIHPDLGNTVDRNISEGDVGYDVWGPRVLWGNVYIAARWATAGFNVDAGYQGDFAYIAGAPPENTFERNQSTLLNYLQTVFMVAPDSASYLNGLGILKNQSATAYQGATFLNNTSGESAIAVGLISGLPALHGFRESNWNYYDYQAYVALGSGGFNPSPTEDPENERAFLMANNREFLRKLDGAGKPNLYLVNLCSYKTDVFEPFESQQLVWTGYYQSLEDVDVTTGEGVIQENSLTPAINVNYYSGATSLTIFGGDTFITRYGYRTTSQDSQLVYLNIGRNLGVGRNIWGDVPLNMLTGFTAGEKVLWNLGNADQRYDAIVGDLSFINYNWVTPTHDVLTTVYQMIIESDDNINFRYVGDVEKGVSPATSVYFDRNVAAEVLYKSPLYDLTKMDNILYEDQYSAVQNLKIAVPYPKSEKSVIRFPGRVIRSSVLQGNFDDTYRYFLALDFKEFPVNRGEITKLFNLQALLHVHTTRSIFRTKGKQVVQMTDASQAYIGTGDLFAQEPEEYIQSVDAYLGLSGVTSGLVIKDGYAFVSRKSRNIFLLGAEGLKNITDIGMSLWARENIPFVLEEYGYVFDQPDRLSYPDSPSQYFGFYIAYDPLFRRIIVTKKEQIPTELFLTFWNTDRIFIREDTNQYYTTVIGAGGIIRDFEINFDDSQFFTKGGWTISYSLDQDVWASRHSYLPKVYGFNSRYMYSMPGITLDPSSLSTSTIFEHSDMENPCSFYSLTGAGFYPAVYNFELDVIFTGQETQRGSTRYANKVYGSVNYMMDAYLKIGNSDPVKQQFNPGFTSYYAYNTTQMSGENALVHLTSIRKVEGHWSFNSFRDLAAIEFNTTLPQVDGDGAPYINVQGQPYTGSYTTSSSQPMFLGEGIINFNYINGNKPWYERRKFIDKFLGVRLISNNSLKNLLSLYIVSAPSRISPR